MICMSYEAITMIIGFTALGLYIEHCTRKILRSMERGLHEKDDR